MPDTVVDPLAGPDGIFATDRPPTRGDWHTIAVLALRVLGHPLPTSRFDATVAAVRLREHINNTERTQ
jgi:hypothetical protein